MGGEGEGDGERGNCVPFKKRKKERGSCDNHLIIMSEDDLINILLCLPVISLLRFKSVCKSWRSIIESPFFINLHAKLGGSSFLFNGSKRYPQVEKNISKLFTLSGDEFEVFDDLGRPPLVDLGEELKNTRLEQFVEFCVKGCRNGIICLHDNFCRNIILWNPAIKQSRLVPKPSNLLGHPNCFRKSFLNPHDNDGYYTEDDVAFGVDAKTKDYKVLLITTLQPPHATYTYSGGRERRVHVYSLSTDSWRCIDMTLFADYPNLQINGNAIQGMYLSGSHIFMASCRIKVDERFCTMPLILSVDLTEENFKTIQLPFDWRKRNTCESTLFIPFGEKLALVDVSERECNVWVLNEEQRDVKESWTKLYTLGYPYSRYREPIPLVCIANNGQFAICWEDPPCQFNHYSYRYLECYVPSLRLLNLITREIKYLQSDCQGLQQVGFAVGIYRPSLVEIGRSGATTNEKCDSP